MVSPSDPQKDAINALIGSSNWRPGIRYENSNIEFFYMSEMHCYLIDKQCDALYVRPTLIHAHASNDMPSCKRLRIN